MIWFTWRQHRGEAMGLAGVLLVLTGVALLTGIPMHRAYVQERVAACRTPPPTSDCSAVVESFGARFAGVPEQLAGQLNLLPVLVGVLIGAPILAREYEHGTWQVAWTQAVPRTRWAIVKLGLILVATTAAALLLSALLSWWWRPLGASSFSVERFNYAAPVLSGYFVLAVATGILAGAVIRRTVPAMVATLVVFLSVRLFAEYALRPRYRTPVTTIDPVVGEGEVTQGILDGDNWVLDTFLVDSGGARLDDSAEYELFGGGVDDPSVLAAEGLRQGVTYQPGSRFWEFQLVEAGLFWLLALTFVLLAIWRVRRW
ncbi:conserved hypothetical protein [Beutenbergia cavernae DSM 12333]|uniref:Transmembrane transport protein n=1 Tax=Beutenbergia cavernae (strain ATCC BAA-8 / DSM 12333 / CCUG 43141 / JCM 11478 / NBRC 16432 / NCIMB 13614 / HKI 0122) TaxID=471853 RepID=C5C056_BEUC1|nr:ABC transporter permease subunit [Beutenbergia cavernae]ACQ79242.1 conserved hypothetical protein [Beutenbergia cavernae DSM 12333]